MIIVRKITDFFLFYHFFYAKLDHNDDKICHSGYAIGPISLRDSVLTRHYQSCAGSAIAYQEDHFSRQSLIAFLAQSTKTQEHACEETSSISSSRHDQPSHQCSGLHLDP